MSLLEPLFRWKAVEELFSGRARLQGMLDFEAALARAEVRAGVIPAAAAPAIAAKCRAELFDSEALARDAALAGNLAIPLVKQLTALVGATDKEAQRFVHWGATSQDAIDTGFVLQLREALRHVEAELERLAGALAQLADKHRATPVAGRTWMQQALPTTFGLKAAGWLDAVTRHRARLAEARRRALVVQFGGAVGTLAALGNKGLEVAAALGEELHLAVPDLPWHAHRDRVGEVAAMLGLLTGTLGKIARDISLHTQTEVGELFEPAAEGRGGSSTMPHKRNPVISAVILAAATRMPGLVSTILSAMVQEQERGLGGWHAEWETMPEIIGLSAGALHHLTETITGLELNAEHMAGNLELTHGLLFAEAAQMALGRALGRQTAHDLVQKACKRAQTERRHLRAVLADDPIVAMHLAKDDLDRLFDPRQYLGVSEQFIDRALAAHSSQRTKTSGESR
ncbi:MAG: 3-carboxy-cis,cis-muconate cycloisomerase [Acidobacteriia bacterium]|nr:3-carboxy-cis,cis-muconate cycloisomerase [Terriglobia bacterium]